MQVKAVMTFFEFNYVVVNVVNNFELKIINLIHSITLDRFIDVLIYL